MNRRIIIAALAPLPLLMGAQTAYDAYQISRYDLRGTARFMSMGGAFGALGGDLSVLGQNPGGIGVYRKSDIGITLDIDSRSISSPDDSRNRTNVSVSNLGYVGSVYTGSEIMQFSTGVSPTDVPTLLSADITAAPPCRGLFPTISQRLPTVVPPIFLAVPLPMTL